MNWAVIGLVYAAAYAALMTSLADQPQLRVVLGNVGLRLPPLAPIAVLARRRADWRGRQAVFWGAIFAWAAIWLVGQLAWASDELLRAQLLPWFKWPIILQLCASALPLIALVAWPHRAAPDETAVTGALDIAVLGFLAGFLYWCLIIAPGMDPAHTPPRLGPGAHAARAANAGDDRTARAARVADRTRGGGAVRAQRSVGEGLRAAGDRVRDRVRRADPDVAVRGARQLSDRVAGGYRLDDSVLLRGVGCGRRADVAGPGTRRDRGRSPPFVAAGAGSRAHCRSTRRLRFERGHGGGRRYPPHARNRDGVHAGRRHGTGDAAAAHRAPRDLPRQRARRAAGDRVRAGRRV